MKNPRGGTVWYVGISRSGKTSLALADLWDDVRETGFPWIILDLARAENFGMWDHLPSRAALFRRVFSEGRGGIYTPEEGEDTDLTFAMLHAGGGVHVLIDEAYWICSVNRITVNLSRCLRDYAHAGGGIGNTYRLTTQHVGDIHRDAFAALTEWRVFRCIYDNHLDKLRTYGFNPDEIRALPQYAHVSQRPGF